MIDSSAVKGIEFRGKAVKQIEDAQGNVLWCAVKTVKLNLSTIFYGMNGDTARITITSPSPFAPDPSNPSQTTTSWTAFVYDEPNCTIELPVGSTIEFYVSRDKGNASSYISLNGTNVLTGEGTYHYTVTCDLNVTIADDFSQGDYGMITIVEVRS